MLLPCFVASDGDGQLVPLLSVLLISYELLFSLVKIGVARGTLLAWVDVFVLGSSVNKK